MTTYMDEVRISSCKIGSTMSGFRRAIWLLVYLVFIVSHKNWAQDVHSTYAIHCANCHGADGRGNTPLGRALNIRPE
jgi:cytochrome c553